ncbi:MAG TPA: YceH family protein [Gaiellaceae bacterium]|nr:YceH family protein [Gaiellaceae bacterium]
MSAHVQRLGAPELRVLGCLIEKQRTTPEQYPLTLNALRLACNQSTSRDPVTDYDEETVRTAAQSLGTRGYARLATGPGSRTPKYRQLFQEALDLMPAEVSILAVLMLRGPQTAAELKTRTARLFEIDDAAPVLAGLAGKELVRQLPRQAGRREERWAHLLEDVHAEPAPAEPPGEPAPLELRLARLEDRVAELERLLAAAGPPG